jgi:hypothetical protein
MMATLTDLLPELTTNQRDIRINQFTPKVCRPWVKEKGKRLINEDLLSLSDFFSRSTTAIPDTFDFAACSGGDRFERFESFFQRFRCLVSRYGRLFVKSLNP